MCDKTHWRLANNYCAEEKSCILVTVTVYTPDLNVCPAALTREGLKSVINPQVTIKVVLNLHCTDKFTQFWERFEKVWSSLTPIEGFGVHLPIRGQYSDSAPL